MDFFIILRLLLILFSSLLFGDCLLALAQHPAYTDPFQSSLGPAPLLLAGGLDEIPDVSLVPWLQAFT